MEDAELQVTCCPPADAGLRELQLQRGGRHSVHCPGGVRGEAEKGTGNLLRMQESAGDNRVLTNERGCPDGAAGKLE